MSLAARLNSRITQVAVGKHLPHRTVRARLTLVYGGLFLLSGAALMAITYALLVNAGFVFTLPNGTSTAPIAAPASSARAGRPLILPTGVLQHLGATTHPSAETTAHGRQVAQCMREHGVSGFPDPTTSVAPNPRSIRQFADRDGAIFAIPVTINEQAPTFAQAAGACGFTDAYQTQIYIQENRQRVHTRQELLIQSGIALAGMSLLSLGLGWLMAGRVLQPLADSHQAQRQFVANASHELRAPLTRLRTLSEVALASPEANFASLRTAHERVLASEQHLEQLIDGLLALTRGQAGLERREQLDLAALAAQAMTAREAQFAHLDLDVRATLATARAAGDPRLLDRLIANLIDNAIRHNTPGGRVEITTGTRDRHAILTITNTGPTVPPEEIQRLFQPFQRLHGTRTRHNSGHGLGLSIVQAIATAHHAELDARPRPEGGLTIEVAFAPATGTNAKLTFATAQTKRNTRPIPESDAPAER